MVCIWIEYIVMGRVSLHQNNVRRPVAPQHPTWTHSRCSLVRRSTRTIFEHFAVARCMRHRNKPFRLPHCWRCATVIHATVHDDNESFNYPNNYTGKAHLVGSEKYAKPTNKTSSPNPTNKQTNEMLPLYSHAACTLANYVMCQRYNIQQIGLHLVFAFSNTFRWIKSAFPSSSTLTIMCRTIWDVNMVAAASTVTKPKLHSRIHVTLARN